MNFIKYPIDLNIPKEHEILMAKKNTLESHFFKQN
jgi:hypothetical protein